MRKTLGAASMGAKGRFSITTEDNYVYPTVSMTGYDGEGVVIEFQHTSTEQLRKIAEMILDVVEHLNDH